MDTNTERILLTLPEKKEASKAGGQATLKKLFAVFFAILTAISLTAHICLGASLIGYIKESDGESFLLSLILPDFTKKEAFYEKEETEIKLPEPPSESLPESFPSPVPEDTATQEKGSLSMDLSAPFPSLKNETSYNPDLDVLYNSPDPIDKADKLYERFFEDDPLVLIYHTHATESYCDTNDTGSYRSYDKSRNMIAVGEELRTALQSYGIATLHLTEMFDYDSYSLSYNKSSAAVEETLSRYPSVQYIIDVHRDSITDADGNNVSADFDLNGQTAAQMMFVVGTDEGGSGHTEWRTNLTSVLHISRLIYEKNAFSLRPVNLRRASFYQDKKYGAMLLEIGTAGNTLEEAKRSAQFFAACLAEHIQGSYSINITEELSSRSVDFH